MTSVGSDIIIRSVVHIVGAYDLDCAGQGRGRENVVCEHSLLAKSSLAHVSLSFRAEANDALPGGNDHERRWRTTLIHGEACLSRGFGDEVMEGHVRIRGFY